MTENFDYESVIMAYRKGGFALRRYQTDAVKTIGEKINTALSNGENYKGQLVAPCASGKTFMAALFAIAASKMNGITGNSLVVAPKLVLVAQLLVDYTKRIEALGLEDEFVSFVFWFACWRC